MPIYNWTPYAPGAVLDDVAIEVVKVLAENHVQSQMLYEIKYTCCGRSAWLTHEKIQERRRTAATGKLATPGLCRACVYKQRQAGTDDLFKPTPAVSKQNRLPDWYISPAHAWPIVRGL